MSPDGPAVLLDRDGVITRRRDDHVKSWDEVEVLPGSPEAIARLCAAGYRVAVVTNQSAVGRGLMTMDTLDSIHRGLDAIVRAAGGEISEFVVCPHRPDAGCACRKPLPGLLLEAGRRLRVDLQGTFMVGDQPTDVLAALAAGCRPILLEKDAADLAAAVDLILADTDQEPSVPTSPRVLVLIATYNERENLQPLLEKVLRHVDADVLIVDDGSPDGTGEIADAIARTEPRVRVVHREGKQGVASAHVLAFRHALESGYDAVIEMDADFSHPPEDLPRLIAGLRRADVVLGSRAVPGGMILGRSRRRNLLTRLGCAYARTVLRLPVRDCTGGFRCSSRRALESIDWSRVTSQGYGFQLELNRAWSLAGTRFEEIPILFPDRRAGSSKMSSDILVEALLVVLRLRLHLVPSAVRRSAGLATSER